MGHFSLCLSMYETLLKRVDFIPETITYLPLMPAHMRQQVFSYLKGPLPEVDPGKVLVKPLFEAILAQILAADYGPDDVILDDVKGSLMCTSIVNLIRYCKF